MYKGSKTRTSSTLDFCITASTMIDQEAMSKLALKNDRNIYIIYEIINNLLQLNLLITSWFKDKK